jgi:hypothetical protein
MAAHQRHAGVVELAMDAHISRAHVGVAGNIGAMEAVTLALAGGFDPVADGFRGFTEALVGELFVGDARDLHVDIDAVEQGPGDTLLVADDVGWGAGAFVLVVPIPAVGAGVQTKRTHYAIG